MYCKAILRLKTGYLLPVAGMAKGGPAHALVLNYTCCIDLPDCIASKYTSGHTVIINKCI